MFPIGDLWFHQVPAVGEFVILPGKDASLRVSRVLHRAGKDRDATAAAIWVAAIWVEPEEGAR
jgi:hypothetical protein